MIATNPRLDLMGLCLGTASGFKINDKLGQDKIASHFFKLMDLEKYDVSMFYEMFTEIDINETGVISTSQLYHSYRYGNYWF